MATRGHLVFRSDALNMQSFVLVKIDQPKTRGRHAKHQPAKLVAWSPWLSSGSRSRRILPFANQTLRRRLDTVLDRLGIPKSGELGRSLDLGSLCPGGATKILNW